MFFVMDPVFLSEITVELVKHSASDSDVVFSARVSTLGSFVAVTDCLSNRDIGLITFLMRERHGSPFEHSHMTFRISAPIFVFREFMRHRIASYNEESGRYKNLDPVFYIPDEKRKLVQIGAPGAYKFEEGTSEQYGLLIEEMKELSLAAYDTYKRLLACGIAREVARMILPLNLYSTMYVTINARSLMNFLSVRTSRANSAFHSYPQREIELCADRIEEIWKGLMPETHAAFEKQGRVAP
ncbi:conserved hypothetical protein [Tropheryma whipplei TW08/27]|uniref:Flavin-dependent thymidylate synthase n=1 Tax=Tropheryma whipplei (strain TW08/27) TaxID=218496 RepID=THYX_TROW8|nr:RecName: Full=Flavin-dependent thymidylate synthase; Short=FDTS; AltName: Full=FAD-dependent thymidylate synthase; AltName: Full=Thymidylate synthase ThyX; Short=TS; Short=TSase [Tropheryma whipplei TW08/27]CAD67297.1 conserved hypothetical protein [Tropheryma whipplei TW08/27]